MIVNIKIDLQYCRSHISRLDNSPNSLMKEKLLKIFKRIESEIIKNQDDEVFLQIDANDFERAVNERIAEIN